MTGSNHDSPTEDQNDPATPDDASDDTDTGSTSPGSYAYSYLTQSTYRVDRPVATYPSNGLATYEGKTLATTGNTQIYAGDALIRVNWKPLGTTTDRCLAGRDFDDCPDLQQFRESGITRPWTGSCTIPRSWTRSCSAGQAALWF